MTYRGFLNRNGFAIINIKKDMSNELKALATFIRSKNAGPFLLTPDIQYPPLFDIEITN